MTTDEQLAAIRERHEQERQWSREKHAEVSPGEPYSESGWCPMDMSLADVSALLNHIAAVTAELAAANARNEHLRMRVREQTAATQEAYTNHEADIRRHLEGIVELGDSSCPIFQRVRGAVIGLKLELEAAAARADEAADARQAAIVAWLRKQADNGEKYLDDNGLDRNMHPSTASAISTMRTLADSIELGIYKGGENG